MNHSLPVELKSIQYDFYLAVLNQLEKDMNMVGIQKNWVENAKPEVFWEIFVGLIKDFIEQKPELFRALLYRIDFNESKLEGIITNESKNGIEEICRQLLIREIEKVKSRISGNWEDKRID